MLFLLSNQFQLCKLNKHFNQNVQRLQRFFALEQPNTDATYCNGYARVKIDLARGRAGTYGDIGYTYEDDVSHVDQQCINAQGSRRLLAAAQEHSTATGKDGQKDAVCRVLVTTLPLPFVPSAHLSPASVP
jgi:hypothetical protein